MTARTPVLDLHGTTILSVRHRGRVVLGGDGQVTVGQTVLKSNARKVRRLYHDRVLAGFAGAGADALRALRGEATVGERESPPRRRGALEGLADRPPAAPLGSAPRGGGPRELADRLGHR